jgi:uncharacterized membrane protein YphA (DoxX/SURF4 family)
VSIFPKWAMSPTNAGRLASSSGPTPLLWLYWFIRLGLSGLFIYAGAIKLTDPAAFARIISAHDLAPDWAVGYISVVLPSVEILAGIGLALGVRGGLVLVTGLLIMFVLVLGFGVMSDLQVDCGCFSTEELQERGSLKVAFYRDIGLVMAALYLGWWKWAHADGRGAFSAHKAKTEEGLAR